MEPYLSILSQISVKWLRELGFTRISTSIALYLLHILYSLCIMYCCWFQNKQMAHFTENRYLKILKKQPSLLALLRLPYLPWQLLYSIAGKSVLSMVPMNMCWSSTSCRLWQNRCCHGNWPFSTSIAACMIKSHFMPL